MSQHGAPAGRLYQLQPRLWSGGDPSGVYRHVYKEGLSKFVRFAENVWGIERDGKSDEALALAGIDALSSFIQEIGLPTTLKELGAQKEQLKEIADSCGISQGSYKPMTHEEILEIFHECYE